MKVKTIATLTENEVILLTSDQLVDDANFSQFAEQFIQRIDAHVLEKNHGADRHCWVFDWKGEQFSLNYEHYCEQIWIENLQYETDIKTLFAIL